MAIALTESLELQATYSNYKNTLQQLAQKIGDVEQEAEEHKLVTFHTDTSRTPRITLATGARHPLSSTGFSHSKNFGPSVEP